MHMADTIQLAAGVIWESWAILAYDLDTLSTRGALRAITGSTGGPQVWSFSTQPCPELPVATSRRPSIATTRSGAPSVAPQFSFLRGKELLRLKYENTGCTSDPR